MKTTLNSLTRHFLKNKKSPFWGIFPLKSVKEEGGHKLNRNIPLKTTGDFIDGALQISKYDLNEKSKQTF